MRLSSELEKKDHKCPIAFHVSSVLSDRFKKGFVKRIPIITSLGP